MMLSPWINHLFPFVLVDGLLILGWALVRALLAPIGSELAECQLILLQAETVLVA